MSDLVRTLCALTFAAACSLGCAGDGLHPAEGKVVRDGKGAEGAVVTFHPKDGDPVTSRRPSAVVAADGSFALTTGTRQGAPAGDYVVTVVWPGDPPANKKGKALSTDTTEPDRPDRLGGRYADPKTSELRATVRAGRNRLTPFDVR